MAMSYLLTQYLFFFGSEYLIQLAARKASPNETNRQPSGRGQKRDMIKFKPDEKKRVRQRGAN